MNPDQRAGFGSVRIDRGPMSFTVQIFAPMTAEQVRSLATVAEAMEQIEPLFVTSTIGVSA